VAAQVRDVESAQSCDTLMSSTYQCPIAHILALEPLSLLAVHNVFLLSSDISPKTLAAMRLHFSMAALSCSSVL
jgi:hypothetical protein